MSCSHFNFNHKIFYNCCGKYYNCNFCHNQDNDHSISKKNKTRMKCLKCNEEQNISNKCIKCSEVYSKYYCQDCKLFSDKELHHCEKCQKCYISDGKKMIHCNKCQKCYSEKNYKIHNCSISNSSNQCQICFENFDKSNKKYGTD